MTQAQILLLTFVLFLLALAFGVLRTVLRVRTMRRALDRNNPDPAAREKVFREVGKRADQNIPAEIHLTPTQMILWKDQDKWREDYNALEERGFQHAGNYRIGEIGVDVQFLMNAEERALACIYNHPVVGVFMDVVTRYEDGASVTFANRNATGLDQHPKYQNRFMGEIPPAELIERALKERPGWPKKPVRKEDLVPDFCRVWKEYKEWRAQRGTSAEEVGRIYERMHANQQQK